MCQKRENVALAFKVSFFIFSVIMFVWVSNGLFDNFIKRRVIVTKSERKSGRDSLPSFLIGVCSRDSSFKDAQKTMYTVAEYMQNSANASKRILMKSAIIRKGQRQIKLQDVTENFHVGDMFTAFNGHCAVLRLKQKLFGNNIIYLILRQNVPSRVFILNEGSQDMADMLFNLETNQNRIDLTPTDWLKYVDLYMDEKIDNVDATCSTSKNYVKSECISAVVSKQEWLTRCSLPWVLSLNNSIASTYYNPCKTDVEYSKKTLRMQTVLKAFHKATAETMQYRECPDMCESMKVKTMDHANENVIREGSHEQFIFLSSNPFAQTIRESGGSLVLLKFPQQGLIKTSTKSYIVDWVAFISNIGGGLGLTLGISIFSGMEWIFDRIFDKIRPH